MNNWKQQKLGIVADVKLSNVDKLTIENERVVRLCNYTDVYKNSFINNEKSESFMLASCNENEYEKFILKKGQVAITKDSETPNDIGVSTYISEDFEDVVLGYHLALITPDNDKLNGQFLHYWLNTKQAKRYFENNAGGSGQRCTLVLDCIKSTPLYLPKLSTQAKIAKVLSDLDAKIELNNRINRELEAMAKTLYDYWFVQFDFPVDDNFSPSGEMSAGQRGYKSSGGKMVYNAELKREIPGGWKVKKLSDIANITTGKLDSNAEVKDGKFYFYTCAENPTRTDSYAFDDSVILVAGNNASGNFHINRYSGKFNAYQRTYVITAKEENYLDYLYQVLERQLKVLKTRGQGSQTKFLTINMLTDIPIFKTDISTIEQFHKIVNPLYLMQQNVLNENQQLSELRDWLLPMLMNGQVKVIDKKETELSMAAEPQAEYKKSRT